MTAAVSNQWISFSLLIDPPSSLLHALDPVSGPLVLGERGKEAGCCARLAAGTEELFIIEFWWFKSYGIAWNHCRSLEALQNCTRAPSLSPSLFLLPPSFPLFTVITFSKLLSYFLFPSPSPSFFSFLSGFSLSEPTHSFSLLSLSVMVLAISSFLTSSFLPIRSYLLVWSLHILLALKLWMNYYPTQMESELMWGESCLLNLEQILASNKTLIVSSCSWQSKTLILIFYVQLN